MIVNLYSDAIKKITEEKCGYQYKNCVVKLAGVTGVNDIINYILCKPWKREGA
tara:strand:- start:529 stop:687 length:159 start_codon:yes stop_codon:yes gene_type:complete